MAIPLSERITKLAETQAAQKPLPNTVNERAAGARAGKSFAANDGSTWANDGSNGYNIQPAPSFKFGANYPNGYQPNQPNGGAVSDEQAAYNSGLDAEFAAQYPNGYQADQPNGGRVTTAAKGGQSQPTSFQAPQQPQIEQAPQQTQVQQGAPTQPAAFDPVGFFEGRQQGNPNSMEAAALGAAGGNRLQPPAGQGATQTQPTSFLAPEQPQIQQEAGATSLQAPQQPQIQQEAGASPQFQAPRQPQGGMDQSLADNIPQDLRDRGMNASLDIFNQQTQVQQGAGASPQFQAPQQPQEGMDQSPANNIPQDLRDRIDASLAISNQPNYVQDGRLIDPSSEQTADTPVNSSPQGETISEPLPRAVTTAPVVDSSVTQVTTGPTGPDGQVLFEGVNGVTRNDPNQLADGVNASAPIQEGQYKAIGPDGKMVLVSSAEEAQRLNNIEMATQKEDRAAQQRFLSSPAAEEMTRRQGTAILQSGDFLGASMEREARLNARPDFNKAVSDRAEGAMSMADAEDLNALRNPNATDRERARGRIVAERNGLNPITGAHQNLPASAKEQAEVDKIKAQTISILSEIGNKGAELKLSPAELARDKQAGSGLSKWEDKGRASVASNIAALEKIITGLDDGNIKTRGFVDALPFGADWARAIVNPEAQDAVDRVRGVIFQTLRETLGAQFTEPEGKRLVEASYNTKLSPELNEERLRDYVNGLRSAAEARESQLRYLKKNKTLQGYEGPDPAGIMSQVGAGGVGGSPIPGDIDDKSLDDALL